MEIQTLTDPNTGKTYTRQAFENKIEWRHTNGQLWFSCENGIWKYHCFLRKIPVPVSCQPQVETNYRRDIDGAAK